jgi:hypothetical protein
MRVWSILALGSLGLIAWTLTDRRTKTCDEWQKSEFPSYAEVVTKYGHDRSQNARLLVSMPCFDKQRDRAMNAINQWKTFPLTINTVSYIDFVLLYATSGHGNDSFRQRVVSAATPLFMHCSFIHYKLTPLQNLYPRATFVHFLNAVRHAHEKGYKGLALMEPDVVILRPYWGDAFLQMLDSPDTWWIQSSPWIGRPGAWSTMGRMNGNALYRTDDNEGIHFFQWALRYEWIRGYDDQLWLSHQDLMHTCVDMRELSSRIKHCSMIVNLGKECALINETQARQRYPDAYMAHISGNCA